MINLLEQSLYKTDKMSSSAADLTNAVDFVLAMRMRDRRFRSVCRQLVLMNDNIRGVRRRYERSMTSHGKRSFRYPQRLRLMTLEGVRDAFTEYAHKEADKLDAMEEQLREQHDIEWEDVANEL